MKEEDKQKRRQRKSRASHFHCYLLRSLDPRHPVKTYIGFTTNPYNRLRQHNGILKNGGARKTKGSGRPWEFVVVIGGFPDKVSALQFEWAWQHPGKSLVVRNAIGDPEAATLSRKRGVRAALTVMRTLITDCDKFFQYKLCLHFTEEKWMNEFIQVQHDLSFPSHMSYCVVNTVEEMPFWAARNKARTRPAPETTNNENSTNHKQIPRVCFLCTRPIVVKDSIVSCHACTMNVHEFCLEERVRKQSIDAIQCPSCCARLEWCPDSDDDLLIASMDELCVCGDDNEPSNVHDHSRWSMGGSVTESSVGELDTSSSMSTVGVLDCDGQASTRSREDHTHNTRKPQSEIELLRDSSTDLSIRAMEKASSVMSRKNTFKIDFLPDSSFEKSISASPSKTLSTTPCKSIFEFDFLQDSSFEKSISATPAKTSSAIPSKSMVESAIFVDLTSPSPIKCTTKTSDVSIIDLCDDSC